MILTSAESSKSLPVPPPRQAHAYSCAPSALERPPPQPGDHSCDWAHCHVSPTTGPGLGLSWGPASACCAPQLWGLAGSGSGEELCIIKGACMQLWSPPDPGSSNPRVLSQEVVICTWLVNQPYPLARQCRHTHGGGRVGREELVVG